VVLNRDHLVELVARMARREATRSEADLQADVRTVLLYGGLNLEASGVQEVNLETPAGLRRRIDVEAGCACIETKKDLRAGSVETTAIEQLAGYVAERVSSTGQRYVGILTDGADWLLYHLEPDGLLAQVSRLSVDARAPNVTALMDWLEGVLATRMEIAPSPEEIERRLGASSSAFALDRADLTSLYRSCKQHPEVRLKRELYAKLLTTAFGTQFRNDDYLFVEHTLLVAMAKLIAHVVLGLRITDPQHSPRDLLTGRAFQEAQIGGVVDGDFFDWVLDAPGGDAWVRSLARRIARFNWNAVHHDVLKLLYESIIDADQRHRLGEYYTPDWLAEHMVADVVRDPLQMRCADVSCGSGTFLFHAVRRHLVAAERAGLSSGAALTSVVGHVLGLDVHPVAVSLARVTYLLAIGQERLQDHEPFSIPVYLGDAVQWRQELGLWSHGQVVIQTSDGTGLFSEELRFPVTLLSDADRFDRLVEEMTTRATDRGRDRGVIPAITASLDRHQVAAEDRPLLEATFKHLCQLEDEGRDRIWSYYVRNLVRPTWLSQPANRVDALVGNPPWLSYRYMTKTMQEQFRQMSVDRKLWAGSAVATQQDLSALFVVRAVEQYLRLGGRFGFVMPGAVLSRRSYAGFRTGHWSALQAEVRVSLAEPWNLGRIRPSVFPVPSCVLRGGLANEAAALPAEGVQWFGRPPLPSASWAVARAGLQESRGSIQAAGGAILSPYHADFRNGATIFPRVLVIVEEAPAHGLLGSPRGMRRVTSRRDRSEKMPWKNLPSIEATVESRFIVPLHLGRTVLPFRCLEPYRAIVPWDGQKLLAGADPDLARYPGLEEWWRQAESVWDRHRSSERLSLVQRIDYQRTLRNQLPTSEHRVVYSASGTYLAAARVVDRSAVIEHKLYWAPCESLEEARYLVAVLNSPLVTTLLEPLQSRGAFGPRDFDKAVFQIPIPRFDSGHALHVRLSELGAQAEQLTAGLALEPSLQFHTLRARCRQALEASGIAQSLNEAVGELLGTST